jgi:hypothetical protein
MPVIISIVAAILVLITCILVRAPLPSLAFMVSLAIVAFFIIGYVLRVWLVMTVFPPAEEIPEEEGMYELAPDENGDYNGSYNEHTRETRNDENTNEISAERGSAAAGSDLNVAKDMNELKGMDELDDEDDDLLGMESEPVEDAFLDR